MPTSSSNSSKQIRESLNKEYVIIPAVIHTIKIQKYKEFADQLYKSAIEAYQKNNDIYTTYIHLRKFLVLSVERIPQHKSFDDSYKRIICQNENVAYAFNLLDEVVQRMDEEYDKILLLSSTSRNPSQKVTTEVQTKDKDWDYDKYEDIDHLLSQEYDYMIETPSEEKLDKATLELIDFVSTKPLPKSTDMQGEMKVSQVSYINRNSLETVNTLSNKSDSSSGCSSLTSKSNRSFQMILSPNTTIKSGINNGSYKSDSKDIYTNDIKGKLFQYPSLEGIIDYSRYDSPFTSSDRLLGISSTDIRILQSIFGKSLVIPYPRITTLDIYLSKSSPPVRFERHDFYVSYSSFLRDLSPDLMMSKEALEMNRCFFLSLGVALGIHPFVLQTAFRSIASTKMAKTRIGEDDVLSSIFLETVTQYAGLVDANVLSCLWFAEFINCRICLISGDASQPLFMSFTTKGCTDNLADILIHCDGQHFTLLRPLVTGSHFQILPGILDVAKANGLVVLESEVAPLGLSIQNVIQNLVS